MHLGSVHAFVFQLRESDVGRLLVHVESQKERQARHRTAVDSASTLECGHLAVGENHRIAVLHRTDIDAQLSGQLDSLIPLFDVRLALGVIGRGLLRELRRGEPAILILVMHLLHDGRTAAVNADNGQEVWISQVCDINRGESITMAPLVVKNKVLVGDSGGEFGVRGSLTALDTETGKIAWKAYNTGPDADTTSTSAAQ